MKILKNILLQIKSGDVEGFLRESAGTAVWLTVIIYWLILDLMWYIELIRWGDYEILLINILYMAVILLLCICAAILTGRPIGTFVRLAEKLRNRLGDMFYSGALRGMLTAVIASCFVSWHLSIGIGITGSMIKSGHFRPAKLLAAPLSITAIILLTITGSFLCGALGGLAGLSLKVLKRLINLNST